MARPCRSVTSTVGRTLILPPRCMANTGSSVPADGLDSNMGYPQCVKYRAHGDEWARRWRARQRRGVSRVAIVPQNAGLLLASVQPRCNTRYRQQAITPINLLQLGTEKAWEYGSGLQLLR